MAILLVEMNIFKVVAKFLVLGSVALADSKIPSPGSPEEWYDMEKRALAGDARRSYILYYEASIRGMGTDKAREWLRLSASQGYPLAWRTLAHQLYWDEGGLQKAAFWCEKAVRSGEVDAVELLKRIKETQKTGRYPDGTTVFDVREEFNRSKRGKRGPAIRKK